MIERLPRRWDGRTGVLGGVCAVLTLASGLMAAHGHLTQSSSTPVLAAGALAAAITSAWCFLRGRLRDVECTSVLLVLLALATVQAFSFTSPSLRWATVFGLVGVPLITLTITRLRWAVVVTAMCLACQAALVLSVSSATLDRVVSLAVLAGDMPLFVGYTAVLLRRAESQRLRAEHAADHDQLTGLRNRRGLWNAVPDLVSSAAARRWCVAVVAIDLDHFKRVNDDFGHDAGDALLTAVGIHLLESIDGQHLAVRVGGEELAVVGCFRDSSAALVEAQRLRRGIAALRVDGAPAVTASIGLATSAGEQLAGAPREVVTRLMTSADRAMYEAKAAGRDQVKVFGASGALPPASQTVQSAHVSAMDLPAPL